MIPQRLYITFHTCEARTLALDRLISTCRVRGCRIVALEFSSGRHEVVSWARITVTCDSARMRLLVAKLTALLEVATVTVEPSAGVGLRL